MNVALRLTVLRIVLVVPGVLSLYREWYLAALVLFVVASLTDFLDGYLARKMRITTAMGAFLDPLADKLLVFLYFAFFLSMDLYPLWLFLGMFARDLVNDGFRGFVVGKGRSAPANAWGKWKATLQMVSLAVLQLGLWMLVSFGASPASGCLMDGAVVLMGIALALGVVGTVVFFRKFAHVLR